MRPRAYEVSSFSSQNWFDVESKCRSGTRAGVSDKLRRYAVGGFWCQPVQRASAPPTGFPTGLGIPPEDGDRSESSRTRSTSNRWPAARSDQRPGNFVSFTSHFSKLLTGSEVRYTSMYPAPHRFCTWSSSRAATVCCHIVHQRFASVHGSADGRQTRIASSGR